MSAKFPNPCFALLRRNSAVFTLRYTEITNYISAECGRETKLTDE
jgi:hypothetical protein